MLAIVRVLEEWRHFVEGAEHQVEIWTDHKNLEYFMTAKKLNQRQACWSLLLARFDFLMHYRPGKTMGKSNALSQRSDHGSGARDNDNMVLLTPNYLAIRALEGLVMLGEEGNILKEIQWQTRDRSQEEVVVKVIKQLMKSLTKSVKSTEWSLDNRILYYRGKIYVPISDLRHCIIALCHDSKIAGHAGGWKTLELVSQNYWWPQMSRYISKYVSTCDMCLCTKPSHNPPTRELHPLPVSDAPWDTISVDFIVKLLESEGKDIVMVVVDSVTKRAHFVDTITTLSAVGTAKLYVQHIWKHNGLPRNALLDRGPQSIVEFMKELYRLLGIKLAATTAYYPYKDGQMERVNQELEQYLCLFINQRQDDWVGLLPFAKFQYNNHIHSTTQQPPFLLDTSQMPCMGFKPNQQRSYVESVNQFKEHMKGALEEAKAALAKSKDNMAKYYNQKQTPSPDYKPRDKVYLDASNIQTNLPLRKLSHQRLGFFPIIKKVRNGAYQLWLSTSIKRLHLVFNIVKLTPAPSDPIEGHCSLPPLPPEIVDGEEEWIVVEILGGKTMNRKLCYLIKWKCFGMEHNSWKPWDNVHTLELITDFHQRHPGAARHIRAAVFDSISFQTSPFVVPGGYFIEGGGRCQGTPSSISDLHLSLYPTLSKTPALVPSLIIFCFSTSLVQLQATTGNYPTLSVMPPT
jgi:Integrase zinc binding domain/RNase H-like domain found in reverse transcriptase/Chromo (CHRromatin Organisation MOdifier) domain